jgi:hypothetical protein
MQLEKELIKDGRHVGLDFYDLLIRSTHPMKEDVK